MKTVEVTYGDFVIATDKLSDTNLAAIVRRGVAHYLGNEQASKTAPTSKWYKDWQEAHNGTSPDEDTIAAQKAADQKAAYDRLLNGEIGSGPRAAPVDPVEKILERLVLAEIKTKLAAIGLKPPKGDAVITFKDGSTRTIDQMRENVLARDGDRLRKMAAKQVADAKRESDRAKAAAEAAMSGAGDLGL